jgi:hypothetical protein
MLAVTTKSNAAGRGYFAAMDDVLRHGSLPVPAHLRSSGAGRSTYRYPHDFEGDDVEQQYLPDKLVGRRYYFPGSQGMEARIAERLERLADGRSRPRRRKPPAQGQADVDPMSAGSEGMRRRRQSMREMAGKQRGDAADNSPKDPPADA